MNESVLNIYENGGPKNSEERGELFLYYVAITRARYALENANLS